MTGLPETEAGFQQAVVELATLRGWLCYHTHDSRRSNAGYPDLTLARHRRLVFAELKSETGRVAPAQRLWLDALLAVCADWPDPCSERCPVEVYVWRPSDWPEVEAVLR